MRFFARPYPRRHLRLKARSFWVGLGPPGDEMIFQYGVCWFLGGRALRTLVLAVLTVAPLCAQPGADIVLILRTNCLACHSDKTLTSGLSLETRESIVRGGNRGADPKLILAAVQ